MDFPIGRDGSCSRLRVTLDGLSDPALNITFPVDAFAGVSNAMICPVIVRDCESAAVMMNGVVTFI